MSTDVKFIEDVIKNLVAFRSTLTDSGDIQIYDAAISVAEEKLQYLESED